MQGLGGTGSYNRVEQPMTKDSLLPKHFGSWGATGEELMTIYCTP